MKFYKFLMVALLAVLLVACTEESDNTVSEPAKEDVKEDSTKKDDKFTYNEGKIGERVIHDDRIAVTVTDVKFLAEKPEEVIISGNERESMPEGTKVVLITTIQEVVAKEQQFLTYQIVNIVDNDGFEYKGTLANYNVPENKPAYLAPKIPKTLTTAIVVPESFDENDYTIHFYEWSDTVKTVLTK